MLLIHGADDQAVHASASRELAKHLMLARRPVQLLEMVGEDHLLILRSADTLMTVVAEWVAQVEEHDSR